MRRHIPWETQVDNYRAAAQTTYETADEFALMAEVKETKVLGHECGHQFTITFTLIGHSSIAGEGPESHHDGGLRSDPKSVTVRASSLRAALRKAATLPLVDWHPEENE